jgi:protein O-GlcNAc transferase
MSGERQGLALRPDDALALESLGRREGGQAWFARALALAPDFIQASINLSAAATAAGADESARRALRRALALAPASDAAWFNLGVALGLNDAAAAAYRRVLALDPEALDAAANLADALRAGDPLTDAIGPYRRALALAPAEPRLLRSLMFCLNYAPSTDSRVLFDCARRWAALKAAADPGPHLNPADPDRRLKLGYLSADLYDHPVGRNLLGLIESHDPGRFDLHVYAEPVREDALTARLKARVATWRSTAGLDDREVARRIRADSIDILVAVAGHTPHNRIEVAAYKPAPLQASLYDFTTSGLTQVDAFLGDPWLTPEGGAERFSETVERLACLYLYPALPEVPVGPRAAGPLILGSSSNPAKLNDRVIRLWARILLDLPEARLRLKYRERFGDPLIQRRWRRLVAGEGVDPARLDFVVGDLGTEPHLKRIGETDIALDPFPFNGATTTYEALWMGVPVVSLTGERFVGRMGLALLAQIGLADLAAASESDYVAKVVGLARDQGRLARLRSSLRDRLKRSPLLDAAFHARQVEAVFRLMWQDWCRRQAETKERNHA